MDEESRVMESSPSCREKENLEPFSSLPPRGSKMRYMMMPLEVKRLISESSSSSVNCGTGTIPNPGPSSPPLKSLGQTLSSGSSPPSASSTPYIKIISPSNTTTNHNNSEDSSRLLFRTPGRKARTPSGPRFNPFETARENLHLPVIMSPSLFATVQSPSQENNEEHFWSLEDRAALFPAIISEDSPWKQEERKLDPEAEIKTQEALNHYFNHHHQITSPLTETSSSSGIPVEASSQTELSFPPRLPEEVEALLAKYSQGGESSSNNNISLRRKLFTNTQGESTTEEGSSGEEEEEEEEEKEDAVSSPIRLMSPGKVILTPPRRKTPQEGDGPFSTMTPPSLSFTRRTSGALSQVMDSPLFSPISRSCTTLREKSLFHGDEDEDTPHEDPEDVGESNSSSFFPYFTSHEKSENVVLMRSVIAEEEEETTQEMPEELSNMESSPLKPPSRELKDPSSSSKLDNLTSSMTTFIDVSEVTLPSNFSVSGNNQLSTIAEGRCDSGMVSASTSGELFPPNNLLKGHTSKSSYMVSYGGGEEGCTNDISVGFPLGSSTPTKH